MTTAVVLVYLSGLSNALIGILVLLSRYQVDRASVLPVSLLGAGIILFGLLTIAVASGLSRGRRFARLLVTIYLGIEFVLHVVALASTATWDWAPLAWIVVDLFIVFALWVRPGSRHFVADATAAADGAAGAAETEPSHP